MVSFADFTYMVTRQPLVDMEQLFCKALRDVHFLHHLLSELMTLSIQLRPANHNYHLPICKYEYCTNVLLLSAVLLILIISKIVVIVSLL